jgi:hypothetical protein
MANYPGETIRFVGVATNVGGELINTGFWVFTNSATTSQAELDSQTAAVAGFWNTMTTTLKPYWYPGVVWQSLKSYYYDGTSNNAVMQSQAALTGNAGQVASAGAPIDTALVCSLRTGFPGRSLRGRMYIPWHGGVTVATGNAATANATAYATAIATMFNSYNSGYPGWCAVVSRTLGSSRPITQVLCDTRPDVQRRRENKLAIVAVQSATVTP